MKVWCLFLMAVLSVLLLFSLVGVISPPHVSALPAGFQEFYLPLPTGDNLSVQPFNGTYSIFNAIEPP